MIEFLVEVQEPSSGKIFVQRYWQTWLNTDKLPNCAQIAEYRSALETLKELPHPSFMSIGQYEHEWRDSIYEIEGWIATLARKLECGACQ